MISAALHLDLSSSMPIERVFQKHVVDGKSHFFGTILGDTDAEYTLRHELAKSLNVSINDVVIMGSAKLGFSVKTADFLLFDDLFSQTNKRKDRSDIDVAIVNRDLFDKINREIYALSRHYDGGWINSNWKINKFYSFASDLHQKYALYLAKGWLRPDYMPMVYFESSDWPKICRKWYVNLERRVSVGFYSDWHYLKNYQMDNLEKLRSNINTLSKMVKSQVLPTAASTILAASPAIPAEENVAVAIPITATELPAVAEPAPVSELSEVAPAVAKSESTLTAIGFPSTDQKSV